jgi:hypothetical protein
MKSGNNIISELPSCNRGGNVQIKLTAPEKIYFGAYFATEFYGRISEIKADEGATARLYNKEYVEKATLSRSSNPD